MKLFKFLTVCYLLINVNSFAQQKWTFDCDMEGWGGSSHPNAFLSSFNTPNANVNSAHIILKHRSGMATNWLFGPPNQTINATTNKHVHFSLTLRNAGTIPTGGLLALFVWNKSGSPDLFTKTFMIYNGQRNYHIDLSSDINWNGTVLINRFHLPNGDETSNGYISSTAEYALDWVAAATSSTYTPTQDNSSECTTNAPILTNPETVIFNNRVSMKVAYNKAVANSRFKLWKTGTQDTLYLDRPVSKENAIYGSYFDLEINTNYNWILQASNTNGVATTPIQNFTTGNNIAENAPLNMWMTPTPFKLTENANDHLLDLDNWPEAASYTNVYKIHGAFYSAAFDSNFYDLDFAKLIYTCNKNRMRIGLEQIVGGNYSGQQYADMIAEFIKNISNYGGKLEFLTWDGMFLHCYRTDQTKVKFRTIEQGIEAVAEATRLIKVSYPNFEIIPLPNLPNWKVRDALGNIIPHNAYDLAGEIGVNSWMDLADLYFSKLATKGVSINYIEIDHPYYYYLQGRATSAKRIKAMKDYCSSKGLDLIIIINQSEVGTGTKDVQDENFKTGCLNYLYNLREDGIDPTYIDVESWYPWPQYITPETKENSFTNVIRDIGKVFNYESYPFDIYGLQNGSFENPVVSGIVYQPLSTDWTYTDGGGIQRNGSAFGTPNAPEGSQTLFLQNINASATQLFNIETSGSYVIKFYLAARKNDPTQPVEVYKGANLLGTFSAPSGDYFTEITTQAFEMSPGKHTIAFANTVNDASAFIDYVRIEPEIPLSVKENDSEDIILYPNPNNGKFNVRLFAKEKSELFIFDVLGKTIHKETLNPSDSTITLKVNLNENANGVYFLKLIYGTKTLIKRVVITK